MKKELIITGLISVLLIFVSNSVFAQNEVTDTKDVAAVSVEKNFKAGPVVKNKLFSFALPAEAKGIYETKIRKDSIFIFHKASKKAGFGGFAFGIMAYKNPSDYAGFPGARKIGELTDKNGKLYDIIINYPTDVQYDYTKSPDAPADYMLLYNFGKRVNIEGVKGAKYFKNQGAKGENLYKNILKKHVTAINEKWDSAKLEKENMSYMYNVLAQSGGNVLDKVGYKYYDINGDGIEELLIGEIAQGEWKGIIYDVYTMVNREPRHVISGGSRDRYYACNSVFVCNEYSSGANESGTRIYILLENSTELFPQVGFKHDGYKDPQNAWFISYGSDFANGAWESVSEELFRERKKTFERYRRFDYIPLSTLKFE